MFSGIQTTGTGTTGADYSANICASGAGSYDGLTYTDKFSKKYTIGCAKNYDVTGTNVIIGTQMDTLLGCLTYCSTLNGCVGVSVKGGITGQNVDNCYALSSISGSTSANTATGAGVALLTS